LGYCVAQHRQCGAPFLQSPSHCSSFAQHEELPVPAKFEMLGAYGTCLWKLSDISIKASMGKMNIWDYLFPSQHIRVVVYPNFILYSRIHTKRDYPIGLSTIR
jgi:hypothetical protein